MIKLILVLLVLLSSLAGATFETTSFDNWFLQQKDWVRTSETLAWPRLGWAEAKLGNDTWTDYELSVKIKPEEYGEDGAVRIYFRTSAPFLTYGLHIQEDKISLNRFDGNLENWRELEKADVGIKAGEIAKIGLKVVENEFTVFLNDKMIIEASSIKYKSGGISLWAENTKFTASEFSIKGTEDETKVTKTLGYYPKGDPRSGGVNDLMLIYTNYGLSWSGLDALPYVTYMGKLDGAELPIYDWFFDSFLFLALVGPNGTAFDAPSRGTPAAKDEWQWFMDSLFEENRQLAGFERAYEIGKNSLELKQKGKVYIMIPNPMAQIKNFGDVDGTGSLNFSWKDASIATDHRFRAVKWYIDQVTERFKAAEFENIELVGFYWLEEMIHYEIPGEADLIRKVSDYLHEKDLKLSWIPWFNASGHKDWESLGFDLCIHQPNYMFGNAAVSRFSDVTRQAQTYGQGIEIEADGRVFSDRSRRERFINYLRAGVTYGYRTEAVHGYYQDAFVFSQAALSSSPDARELYDMVYNYVKGDFDEPLGAKTQYNY